jgi:hypothetical protein
VAHGRPGVDDPARHRVDHLHAPRGHDHLVLAQPAVADVGQGRGRIHGGDDRAVGVQDLRGPDPEHGLELPGEPGLFRILAQGAGAHREPDVAQPFALRLDRLLQFRGHGGHVHGVADGPAQLGQLGERIAVVDLGQPPDLVVEPVGLQEQPEGRGRDGEAVRHLQAQLGPYLAEQGDLGAGLRHVLGPDLAQGEDHRTLGRGGRAREGLVHGEDDVVEHVAESVVLAGGHEAQTLDHLAHAGRDHHGIGAHAGNPGGQAGLRGLGHLRHQLQGLAVRRQQEAELLRLVEERINGLRLALRVPVNEIEQGPDRGLHGAPPA